MPTRLRRLVLPVFCAAIGLLAFWLGTVEGYGFVRWAGLVVIGLSALGAVFVLIEDRLPGAHGAGVTAADLRPLATTRAELAARLGWEVRNSDAHLLDWARTGLLADGGERRANHVLTGVRHGLRFAVFEYVRRRPGDDGPVGTTVWMVLLPEPVPPFELWRDPPHTDRAAYRPLAPGWSFRAAHPAVVPPVLTRTALARLEEGGLVHLQAEGPTLITHRPGFASAGGAQSIVVRDVERLLAVAQALPAP
ncbi:hypothetical protein ACPPVO_41065 [Dactylosporangium sp. McL0621]|uniref:hypothetical protein n=1 Tax=Dactylosporangium sp. McL0621 TaxID=3415678 RepID=UPI003CFA01C7